MRELLVVLAGALAVVSRPYAQSASQVFHPTADARVFESNPTKSYGADSVLRIRAKPGGGEYRTFLRFVLPDVAQTVETVKLRLYCTDGSSDGGTVYVRL